MSVDIERLAAALGDDWVVKSRTLLADPKGTEFFFDQYGEEVRFYPHVVFYPQKHEVPEIRLNEKDHADLLCTLVSEIDTQYGKMLEYSEYCRDLRDALLEDVDRRAKQIASHLEGWEGSADQGDSDRRVTINLTMGSKVISWWFGSFSSGTIQGFDKWLIHADKNEGERINEFIKIGVSSHRPPAAVAGEIRRRLIPLLDEAFEKAVKRDQMYERVGQAVNTVTADLSGVCDLEWQVDKSSAQADIPLPMGTAVQDDPNTLITPRPQGTIKVDGFYGGAVAITLINIAPVLARKIIRIIRKHGPG